MVVHFHLLLMHIMFTYFYVFYCFLLHILLHLLLLCLLNIYISPDRPAELPLIYAIVTQDGVQRL